MAIQAGGLLLLLPALFIPRIRSFVRGRKNLLSRIRDWRESVKGEVIWVHCASLGEFEMARPLIDHPALSKNGQFTVMITFFSPSGYEVVNRTGQYNTFYIPLDTRRNARRFLSIVKPAKAIFVKNEFWFNFLHFLESRHIPVLLVNGIIRPDQIFFKTYGGWFRKHLSVFSHFFLQDERSVELIGNLGVARERVTLTGDMRYDRVADIREKGAELPEIAHFKTSEFMIIGGSTWPPEEEILADFLNTHSNFDCILAPHDVSPEHIKTIERHMLPFGVQRYSEWDRQKNDFRVLIIDSVGLLSRIYRYGDLAFVGGGFGTGLHNILEPAGFGLPVLFGPKISRFPEAQKFIDLGIGFRVLDLDSFSRAVRAAHFSRVSENVEEKMKEMQGATQIIVDHLNVN